MNHPAISIILPSYNRENYISLTIESCLSQTYQNFELIIVDDCSSDNSLDIIKKYAEKDKRIRFIINESNKKLPAALNIGFKSARGKYFTWISDDNLFHPKALQKMVSILNSQLQFGLVYADYITIDKNGKSKARIYQEPPEFLPIRDCVGACFLYRSDLAKMVGEYNEKLFLIEDYEYWLRLGLITEFYHITEPLYFYRIHKHSLTKSRKAEITKAKNMLKIQFSGQYNISKKLTPINELYMWFISRKTFSSYFQLAAIIIKNPLMTLQYIARNFRRL